MLLMVIISRSQVVVDLLVRSTSELQLLEGQQRTDSFSLRCQDSRRAKNLKGHPRSMQAVVNWVLVMGSWDYGGSRRDQGARTWSVQDHITHANELTTQQPATPLIDSPPAASAITVVENS